MVLILALGCQPRMPTEELFAQVAVVGFELDVLEVDVLVEDWEGQVFELRDDDRLTLFVGDEEVVMTSGQLDWSGEVPPEGLTVSLQLARNWSLPAEASVVVPGPLALTSPAEGDRTFNPAEDDIDLAWGPSGSEDNMSYEVEGDCVYLRKRFFGDAGVARIPSWSWPESALEGCEATITMNRAPIGGTGWSGWSGDLSASRHSTLDVRLTP